MLTKYFVLDKYILFTFLHVSSFFASPKLVYSTYWTVSINNLF